MSISQLHLHPFDEKKIYCNENAKQEAERIKGRAINKKISNWDLNEMQTFKISTLNIRSLKKHFIDLKQDHLLQKSDIICVNETWLESDPAEDLNNYHGYFLNLNSRGNAIFCKMEPNTVQKIASENASIIVASYTKFDLISVYRYSDNSDLEAFTKQLLECLNLKKTVIVLGDMNIDLMKHPQNKFTKALTQIGFQQLVKCSTHILGGLLDHVYAFCPNSSNCTLYKTHPLYFSDHDAVTFFLQIGDD